MMHLVVTKTNLDGNGLDDRNGGGMGWCSGACVKNFCNSGGGSLNGGAAMVLGGDEEISSTLSLFASSSSKFRFPTLLELFGKDPPQVVSFFSTNSLTAFVTSLRRFSTKRMFFSL